MSVNSQQDSKNLSDIQLIDKVKSKQDSSAIMELAERHTGIYLNVISQYTFVPKVDRDDLIDHKLCNIYQYALDYDPTKEAKFSTYIGQRIKWDCQTILTAAPKTEEITDNIPDDGPTADADTHEELVEAILDCPDEITDPRFSEIFNMRHPKSGSRATWKEIGTRLGLTYEGVRKIYNKNIVFVQARIKQGNLI